MNFDKILMNPPYSNGLGGKITFEVISLLRDNKDCICLMPLSNYKNKSAELWRKVKTFELADPKLFVDADITKNLCICTLENKNVDKFKSYDEMSMESYDPRFKVFYEVNSKLPSTFKFYYQPFNPERLGADNETWHLLFRRAVDGRTHGNGGRDYKWNIEKSINVIDTHIDTGKVRSDFHLFHFTTKKACDNYNSFFYCGQLSPKLLGGLNKTDGTPVLAIPQIDWETISDNPLWKEGKYDEAVLLEMDLMWDKEKNNIVRKNN